MPRTYSDISNFRSITILPTLILPSPSLPQKKRLIYGLRQWMVLSDCGLHRHLFDIYPKRGNMFDKFMQIRVTSTCKNEKLFRGIALLGRSTYGLKNLENSSSLRSRELSIYSGHKLRPSSCNTCKCFCFWLRCGDPDRTLVKVLPAPGYLPKAHCSSTHTRYLYLIPTQPKKKTGSFFSSSPCTHFLIL